MYYYIVQWGLISDIIQDLQDLQGERERGRKWVGKGEKTGLILYFLGQILLYIV